MQLQTILVRTSLLTAMAAACTADITSDPPDAPTLVPPAVNISQQKTEVVINTIVPSQMPTQSHDAQDITSTPNQIPYSPQILSIHYTHNGDTLPTLSRRYKVDAELMRRANLNLPEYDFLEKGTSITIPDIDLSDKPPPFLIIPDSELVYGPGQRDLDLRTTVEAHEQGWLAKTMAGQDNLMPGWEVVYNVAMTFSVNPRLLLSLLEYQTGLLTGGTNSNAIAEYPLNVQDWKYAKLTNQLVWAAENLNAGYYGWRQGHISELSLADGETFWLDPRLNAGTVAVYSFFSHLYSTALFETAISPNGFASTYENLFGNPFNYDIMIIEPGLRQPEIHLPFEPGVVWYFTGGPHNSWRDSAPWAALDFAPPLASPGCSESTDWVVAPSSGVITRIGPGLLAHTIGDSDTETTGWTLVYAHLRTDTFLRQVGQRVKAGERLGQPSCDGGLESTGTHLHIARKFNGEWMPAGGPLKFVLGGWETVGEHRAYHGKLVEQHSGNSITACACEKNNQISRPR